MLLASCVTAAADDVGRALYTGRAPDAPPARIGGMARPGLTCFGCHGRDAGGGGEGRSRIPPIDGPTLSSRTQDRTAYDAATFHTALSQGRTPDGRLLSLAMPRFDFSTLQSGALWRHLDDIVKDERSGVSATEVRIAVPTTAEVASGAERLRDELQRQWTARGAGMIHGRAMTFIVSAVEPDAPATPSRFKDVFLAVGPDLDAAGTILAALRRAGIPVLGPVRPPSGERWADLIRIGADPDQIVDGLMQATDPTTTVVIDDTFRKDRAVPATAIAPDAAIPSSSSRIVLLASAPAARAFIDANRSRLHGRTVVLPESVAEAPDLVRDLMRSGADVRAARAAGDPADLVAFASALTAVLESALVATGRQLTRARFMTALDSVRVQSAGWPDLDYRRYPGSGTAAVRYMPIPAR